MSLPSVIRHMAVGALMLIGASAQGAHQLAYSKSMGVTVFAEGDAQWCDQQLQLTIDADNAGFFASPELQRLLQVLGTKVLANDCALAEAAQIEGRYQGATVWQGSTSKRGGWAVEEMATEKPAVVEVPAGQALLQAAADDVKADDPAAAAALVQPRVVDPPPTEAPTAVVPTAPTTAPEPEITTAPTSALGAVAAAKPAVAPANFAVAGWTPEPVLKQKEGQLDSVASKDERCAVHYSVRANDKGLVYLESDLPCVDGWIHGNGKALIKRVDGKQIAQMNGNFSRGFFTAQDDLDPASVVGVSTEPPNNLLALLKIDTALKAYYVGNVAVIGANRWGLCYYAQVRLVTENQDLFLDEAMIDTVVQSAAELVADACPKQHRFRFSAGPSPWDFDKQDHNVNYYVTQVQQDRRSKTWAFNKSRAWNGVIAARIAKAEQERIEQQRREREEQLAQQRAEQEAKQAEQRAQREAEIARQAAERQARQDEYRRQQEQQRAEQAARAKDYQEQQARYNKWRQAKRDYDRLAGMGGVARLAYLANTAGPRFPLDLYAEQVSREKPVNGAVLVRVSDDESDHSEVDWPVEMRLEDKAGVIDDEGVYFVVGQVTGGERRDDELPIVTMAVEKAWLCKERLCNDHGDVLGMVKTRHDFPDFDPEQQPEQPRWR